jgi:isocitrate/isopropylmalate dehydrogenase
MATSYPDVEVGKYHIDILTANFVMHPDWFEVVVASMMLDHLGEPTATAAVLTAIETVLARGGDTPTPDMGGTTASTEGLGKAVADAVTAS